MYNYIYFSCNTVKLLEITSNNALDSISEDDMNKNAARPGNVLGKYIYISN